MEIPDDRYYGIQTSRMVKVSGCAHLPIIFYPGMHRALAGEFDKKFQLDMWQAGGYTCVNMNVNEVIGNAANEILTGRKVRTPCTRTPM